MAGRLQRKNREQEDQQRPSQCKRCIAQAGRQLCQADGIECLIVEGDDPVDDHAPAKWLPQPREEQGHASRAQAKTKASCESGHVRCHEQQAQPKPYVPLNGGCCRLATGKSLDRQIDFRHLQPFSCPDVNYASSRKTNVYIRHPLPCDYVAEQQDIIVSGWQSLLGRSDALFR